MGGLGPGHWQWIRRRGYLVQVRTRGGRQETALGLFVRSWNPKTTSQVLPVAAEGAAATAVTSDDKCDATKADSTAAIFTAPLSDSLHI